MKYLFLSLLFVSLLSCSKSGDEDIVPDNQAPKAFTLTSPASNATGFATTPALSWQAATDPDGDTVTYSVYLDQNVNPITLIKSGLTAVSYMPTTALANNIVYYWKVVATDAKGATTASSVFKFTTVATVPATKSLPVKVTHTNISGAVTQTSTITYDNQKRINKVTIVNQTPNQNLTNTFSYEADKITEIIEYNDPAIQTKKQIYYYNANGVYKEEQFFNGTLRYIIDWYYRPDGGKERRIKNTSGNLLTTWYYRFGATGNIERVVIDDVNVTVEDWEYIFSNYDTKLRSISNPVNDMIAFIMMGFPGTNFPAPNNPQAYIRKSLTSGNVINTSTLEYTYNNKNQVTVMKIKDANNGSLKESRTIDYQEF
ncbi:MULTISPECIES: hypothetical protein [Flavobacterium]|uniref:Fibronectin type-III domain-containing protein n=1 Tax=Flavobacterium chungangense TaxID=554283 RepID=A0A6V6Z1M0_9FLAO|nr:MULTISPECIES: hypothetical protein [Flavobacterium]CAD0004832.1 hypothetical protein FLACHUCJ7_02050 [Flavobacterium chungangense]